MNDLKQKFIFKSNNKKLTIDTIMTQHGNIKTASYLINNNIFYGSDVNKIFEKDLKKLYQLKYFIIDCLRYEYHPSHYNLNEVLEIVKKIKPKKNYFNQSA